MYKRYIFAASALVLASACVGSSTNPNEVSREITGPGALNIGSQSTTVAATGLPFADDIDPDTFEFDDSQIPVRLVRFETDHDTGETRVIVSEEFFTIPLGSEGLEANFTYKGETITFVNRGDPEDNEADAGLSNGQTLGAYLQSEGQFGQAVGVWTYDREEGPMGFDSEGMFIVGLETNPDALPTGRTGYSGDFFGFGNTLDLDGNVMIRETQIQGEVGIDIEFGTGDLEGELAFSTNEFESDLVLYGDTLRFDTTILGNGFSAVADETVDCEAGCTSTTQIGGAFFGPGGEELIGLAGIDYTNPNVEDGIRLVGAGSFIAFEDR